MAEDHDPLGLTELFSGGAEPWISLLRPTLEALPNAADFIGPGRSKSIVPVRELTFQALKPNPPERWKVVVFGQNPYPRVESATGIAMFDNAFAEWNDSRFGKVTSIRCIVKAACIWKLQIDKKTSTSDIRLLLHERAVVSPPAWFQAMLTQGVLLLNASLTASTDDSLSTSRHTSFWRPVVEQIVEGILDAKRSAPPEHKGVVFAWWGNHAKALRTIVERLHKRYPDVPLHHVDHCNPAAMGDAFCAGDHFGDINAALKDLGLGEVDWLPSTGWDQTHESQGEAQRMGDFIAKTMKLHKFYLDRLQGVADEAQVELSPVSGLFQLPCPSFDQAVEAIAHIDPGLSYYAKRAKEFAEKKATDVLDRDETASVFLYTLETALYKRLNATLRDPNREHLAPFKGYLRLFLGALMKLRATPATLFRGVGKDLRPKYPKGSVATWWGVSSCTSKLEVARGFLGAHGRRTLFEVRTHTAVSIRSLSAFTGEEELVLAPGTQLRVTDVTTDASGLSTVRLEECEGARLVA